MKSPHTITSVILAAGEGTRMKSSHAKVLHALGDRPLIAYSLAAARAVSSTTVVVVGHKGNEVQQAFASLPVRFTAQEKQRGSGDALRAALPKIPASTTTVLVLCGDTPFLRRETLITLLRTHHSKKHAATILTAVYDNPFGYGRITRDAAGNVLGIVEEKDASLEEKAIREINSGVYCFNYALLKKVIHRITSNNAKKEYYLTDAMHLLRANNGTIGTYTTADPSEIMGVNTRADLATAHAILYKRNAERLMAQGVTIVDPNTTYICNDVTIGNDTILFPGCMIQGSVTIGTQCVIGPYSMIDNSTIGDTSEVVSSKVSGARIANDVHIGPFAHIRKGTVVRTGCKIGNFTETKNAVFGIHTKASHLSYIGDAIVGNNVNIGAGTITCNYDGTHKNKTIIRDNVFVGSNSNLVAPVTVGKNAFIAAGSTVCENVPTNALAIARSRQVHKLSWKKKSIVSDKRTALSVK